MRSLAGTLLDFESLCFKVVGELPVIMLQNEGRALLKRHMRGWGLMLCRGLRSIGVCLVQSGLPP